MSNLDGLQAASEKETGLGKHRPKWRARRGGISESTEQGSQWRADLQALVETGVFGRGCEVGDRVSIGAALGNGGLAWVVGCIVVQVGDVADQRVRVAHPAHAHLLARHELQGAVRAEVQHCIRLHHPCTIPCQNSCQKTLRGASLIDIQSA